jgi:hypothetical protein
VGAESKYHAGLWCWYMAKEMAQGSQMRMALTPTFCRSLLPGGEARSFFARWFTWRKRSAAEGGCFRMIKGNFDRSLHLWEGFV